MCLTPTPRCFPDACVRPCFGPPLRDSARCLERATKVQERSGSVHGEHVSRGRDYLAPLCPLVGLPSVRSWPCIVASGALHILYNFLLLQKYKNADFSSAYPISRGVSPVLVTLGALLFMHQRLALPTLLGVGLISSGILLQITGKNRLELRSTLPAFATGGTIAAYTVVDTIGVQRSNGTASYSVWIFASYVFVPLLLRLLRMRIRLFDRASLPGATSAGVFSLIAYTIVLWATHFSRLLNTLPSTPYVLGISMA